MASRWVADDLPEGFLGVDDLGVSGSWTAGHLGGDRCSSPALAMTLPVVAGHRPTSVTGSSTSQVYRGTIQVLDERGCPFDDEWILGQSIMTLSPSEAARAAEALDACAAEASPGIALNFGGELLLGRREPHPMVVCGNRLVDGSIGFASAYVLVGTKLLQLETLPGGADGGVALPSGPSWLVQLAGMAAARIRPEPRIERVAATVSGPGAQGGIPSMLRSLAESIEQLGPVEVLDIGYQAASGPHADNPPSIAVFYRRA